MAFFKMFGKSMMENANLPKISILLQSWDEILAMSCSDNSILQIFVILSPFQNNVK